MGSMYMYSLMPSPTSIMLSATRTRLLHMPEFYIKAVGLVS